MVTVRLPRPLWQYVDGEVEVLIEAKTLRQVFASLRTVHPRAYERILTEPGEVRTHVNIFVNRKLVRSLVGPEASLSDGDVITVLPAISGG